MGAAAVSPAAFGVSTGDFLAEAGIGAVCGHGALAGWSGGRTSEPYVDTARGSDGAPVPVYGIALNF